MDEKKQEPVTPGSSTDTVKTSSVPKRSISLPSSGGTDDNYRKRNLEKARAAKKRQRELPEQDSNKRQRIDEPRPNDGVSVDTSTKAPNNRDNDSDSEDFSDDQVTVKNPKPNKKNYSILYSVLSSLAAATVFTGISIGSRAVQRYISGPPESSNESLRNKWLS